MIFKKENFLGKAKFDFTDQVVLVTGAAMGIGRQVAVDFGKAGAKVIVSDIDADKAHETVNLINKDQGESIFIKCDVSKEVDLKNLIQKIIEEYGQLNIACNNAGIEGSVANIDQCSVENWNNVMQVNLTSVFLSMKYEIPEILKSKGTKSIINLSSIAGLVGFAGLPAYVASKHGVIGLTKNAALEYANQNLRVNAICPGPIKTPMLDRITHNNQDEEKALSQGVPLGRLGDPEEVSSAILYLCSDQASYISGQVLPIDGGWVTQ